MSIFRNVIAAGLIGAFAVASYAVDIDLEQDVILDDFNNDFGDAPNQCSLGGFYGVYTSGKASVGKGYWYFYKDAGGSEVTDVNGEAIANSTVKELMLDSTLHCKINTSTSDADVIYAGIGCNLIETGDYEDSTNWVNLSGMTAISMKIKGSGKVRFRIETEDVLKNGDGWGFYGYDIKLTSDWKTLTIPAEDLLAEEGYEDATTFDKGGKRCCKMAFQVVAGTDCELQVDDIKCVGLCWGDLGFEPGTKVTNFKAAEKSKFFSVCGNNVSLNLPKAQDVSVTLTDLSGKCVQKLFNGNTASAKFSINDRNLTSGRYFVVATGKNVNYTQSIVIAR